MKSKFYQTNYNPDARAYKKNLKYIADDTYFEDEEELEDAEGAVGNITVIVDGLSNKYFVLMKDLSLNEATFDIEN